MVFGKTTDSARSSQSIVKIKIAATIKLDESNFFSWKAHMLANLRGYELLDFIDAPVDKSDPLAVQQFTSSWLAILSALSFHSLSSSGTYDISRSLERPAKHLQCKITKPETSTTTRTLHLQEMWLDR